MALVFPSSPALNDTYTVGQRTWTWNGSIWELSADTIGAATVTASELASNAVTTAKIADGAITAAKIADGTIVAAEIASNAVTTAKILDANVTADKLSSNAVTTAKILDAAVTQAKLGTTLSAVTVTTAANRDTAVTSPFTGQLVFLTDTKKIQVWDGTSWLNITLAPPETPTSLSATALSTTSVSVAFTPGGANGSPITNYKYATSADNVTYSAYSALDPADTTSPITISGLSQNTSYYIKLKAVNDMGDSVASAAVTVTTLNTFEVNYLVVAGGGGGASSRGGQGMGGGGAGGLRSTVTATGGGGSLESALSLFPSTNYAVTIGSGGAYGADTGIYVSGNQGGNSSFSTITSLGGSGGASSAGGGGGAGTNTTVGTANQGFNGSNNVSGQGGGGGGAGEAGGTDGTAQGGDGVEVAITGSNVFYAGGGGGGWCSLAPGFTAVGGAGGGGNGSINGTSATVNTGGGGGGGGGTWYGGDYGMGFGGNGGSGIVILRYPNTFTITLGAGLTGTTTTVSTDKVTTITAGTGNVSWS